MSTLSAFDKLRAQIKTAFVPMGAGGPMPPGAPPGGAPPMDPAMMGGGGMPMDPAMMGGAPPMDPAMMGGAPPMDPAMMMAMMGGGGMPMDPAMMGGAPPPGGPPPSDPAAGGGLTEDSVRRIVAEVVGEAMGGKGGKGAGNGKPKVDPVLLQQRTLTILAKIADALNIQLSPTEAFGDMLSSADDVGAEGSAKGPAGGQASPEGQPNPADLVGPAGNIEAPKPLGVGMPG